MLNWFQPADGRAGLMGLDLEALGIPTVEEAVERYVARTGYPVPPMDWYFAYNLFRLAGIMQGIKKRVIDGTASSAHAQAMSERVRPLAERALPVRAGSGDGSPKFSCASAGVHPRRVSRGRAPGHPAGRVLWCSYFPSLLEGARAGDSRGRPLV